VETSTHIQIFTSSPSLRERIEVRVENTISTSLNFNQTGKKLGRCRTSGLQHPHSNLCFLALPEGED
jgi:hypothetical protein